MSEYLKNQEYKKEFLKSLIEDLHKGRDFKEVKEEFNEFIEGVDAVEIADIEQQLIKEGMQPEEITKLCDVHAAIFRDALQNEQPELVPGHPLYSICHENGAARKAISKIEEYINKIPDHKTAELDSLISELQEKVDYFYKNLDKHYSKKENILFPYLEKHNITGPPSVMWSVDDEIRTMVKDIINLLNQGGKTNKIFMSKLKEHFNQTKEKISEMFSKEEDILTPMLKDTLTDEEWAEIKAQESEFGIIFTPAEEGSWQPKQKITKQPGAETKENNAIKLQTGRLTPDEINTILMNLPIDITFVNKDDQVAYFSQTEDRVFVRTRSIIGRKVQNCHPPESVHIVEKIVSDFKSGKQDKAEFWLEVNNRFIHISYIALRDKNGDYMGAMEVTQDISSLKKLKGERRLLKYSE